MAVGANEDANPPTEARLDIRVGPNATEIATVAADVAGAPLAAHHQKVNFSLSDGSNLLFQIGKDGLENADINVRSGEELTASDSPYNFKLTVNEFENAPGNSVELNITGGCRI